MTSDKRLRKAKKVAKASPPNAALSLQQQWEAKKPERPKPPTGRYPNFISEFAKHNPSCREQDLIREGSKAWNKLSAQEKQQYEDEDEREEYERKKAIYDQTIKAMKRPAESFGLFNQHYWKTKSPKYDGTKHGFGQIQKRIGQEWKSSSPEVKSAFKAASQATKVMFQNEQTAVLSGKRDLNLNWRPDAISNVSKILQGTVGGKQGIAVQNASVAETSKKPEDDDDGDDDEDHEMALLMEL